MKKVQFTPILLGIFTIFFLVIGCQKDDPNDPINQEGTEEEFVPVYYKGIAAADTGDPSYPYMVQHENGEVMLLTVEGDTPTGVVYFLNANTIVQLSFDEELKPTQIVYNNEVVVLFENYRDNLVDLAVISNGDFQIYRDIELPDDGFSKEMLTSKLPSRWTNFFSALGTTLNIGLCAIGAAATAIPSLGTSIPAATITCGGALLGSVLLLSPSDNEQINATGESVGYAANAFGCLGSLGTGGPLAAAANCVNSMIDATSIFVENKDALIQTISEIIAAAQGGLRTGDGDVKFTLTWDNDTDLDLYVTEPSGDVIWYGNRYSTTGGELDVDDRDGFGPENIFWPTDFARPGSYRVEVKMYSGNKPTTFRLKPKVGNAFYNTIVMGIEYDTQIVFVGSYIVYAGENGRLISKFVASDEGISSTQNLNLRKN